MTRRKPGVKVLCLSFAAAVMAGCVVAAEPCIDRTIGENVFAAAKSFPLDYRDGSAVCLEGDVLYFGSGHSLHVYDVARAAEPVLLGSVSGIGVPRQIASRDGMVYISTRGTGLWIVDAKDPRAPKIVSRYDSLELATGICVSGDVVMLGQRPTGVEFIDVSDPAHPQHIRVERTRESQSVVYHDGFCYSGEWYAGEVTVVDAHDLSAVKTVSRVKLHGHGDGVDALGDRLYAATGHHRHVPTAAGDWTVDGEKGSAGFGAGHGLEIFDISDRASPKFLGRCEFARHFEVSPDLWIPRASAEGRYVFCADTYNGLYAVDAADPTEPKIVGRITVPPEQGDAPSLPVVSLAVGDGAVYFAVSGLGLCVAKCPVAKARGRDRAAPPANAAFRADCTCALSHLTEAWRPRTRARVQSVVACGDCLYVACGSAGLAVLKEFGGTFRQVGGADAAFCGDVQIRCGKLYSAEAQGGLAVYDLACPESPRLVERVTQFGTRLNAPLWVWAPTNTSLVVMSERENVYLAYDEADSWRPSGIRMGGSPSWDKYVPDVLAGGFLGVSMVGRGFCWCDFNAHPPRQVKTAIRRMGMNAGSCGWRDGRVLAVVDGSFAYLRPGETAEPEKIAVEGGPADGVPAWDGAATVALTQRLHNKVRKVDVTDERHPRVLWTETVVGFPERATFWKGRMIVPCGYQGLLVEFLK